VCLTVLFIFTFEKIRTRFYEWFYWTHVLLALGFMVTCIFHHPWVAGWLYAALLTWLVERSCRGVCSFFVSLYDTGSS
jgi:hypothetical protein